MKTPFTLNAFGGLVLSLVVFQTHAIAGDCTITELTQKLEGADRTILRMENDRIRVDIVPSLAGRTMNYILKPKTVSPMEWLDDCPYHYGGRWEGTSFTHRIDTKGPDRAAITVIGSGKIPVGLLHGLGIDVANPLELGVERTMWIERDSTRLHTDVKVTNVGDGVAPAFRYMVHAVFGDVPVMPSGRAYWFLPTSKGVEFFDDARGNAEMWTCASGAPLDHPFSRFMKGMKADKPRYEPGGWGALLTSAGPAYISYKPESYDFIQYWFGGDAEWHFTFEPQTKPVDLKPGDTATCSFTFALDGKDIEFNSSKVSYEIPVVPKVAMPDSKVLVQSRATTVGADPEHAKMVVEVKGPDGKVVASQAAEGEVKSFSFTPLSTQIALPAEAVLGIYTWMAAGSEGKQIANGKFEVLSAADAEKRKIEGALAELRASYDTKLRDLSTQTQQLRRETGLWADGASLALGLNDRTVWSDATIPTDHAIISVKHDAIKVLGNWKSNEAIRIDKLASVTARPWPESADKMLASLGNDRGLVRDVALQPDGKGLVVLLVDPAKNRVEVVLLSDGASIRRFGRFSDKPREADDTLGIHSRALAVDSDGNIWVGTNAWGQTSVYRVNQDNSPYEEGIIGDKGALRKFGPDGKLLGTIGLLDVPMDLFVATADGTPAILASYRNVSAYHGAQVREGVMIVNAAQCKRMNEIKIPGGSVCIDAGGRVWVADVAGHVAIFDRHGLKLQDIEGFSAAAVPDAKLPAGSPLPVILRPGAEKGVWALATLHKKLHTINAAGTATAKSLSELAGSLLKLSNSGEQPVIFGDTSLSVISK